MKKVYISYDVIADEIIDAFVRKNDEAAKRDFIRAFQQQSKDSTHVKLFNAYPDSTNKDSEIPINVKSVEGIPVREIWDSELFEMNYGKEEEVEN